MSSSVTITSALPTIDLKNKRVFLRADLNIPLNNKSILDDYRLESIKPTLDIILNQGAKIILATHIGRPSKPDPALSTDLLIGWFEKNGYKITFESNLIKARDKSYHNTDTILLLENMRFFPGEKKGDLMFAQQLAQLADYYVNDAFALLHRNDTSTTIVPTLFTPHNRTIGLLIEKELKVLYSLLHNPSRPFVLIVGGGKVADKLPLLYALINSIDTVLLCPAVVFSFLKIVNKAVGKSLVDYDSLNICTQFLKDAQARNIKLLFPSDYQIAEDNFNGPLSFVAADQFPENGVGISIGANTIDTFAQEIENAGTIFANGLMGSVQRKQTLSGAHALFQAMGRSKGLSIVGGGDSVAATRLLHIDDTIDFLSTGGGATLAYLAGQDLPGLHVFLKDWAETKQT